MYNILDDMHEILHDHDTIISIGDDSLGHWWHSTPLNGELSG